MQNIFRKTAALGAAMIGFGLSAHQAQAQGLVISQVYGGGGITGATYSNDFVELYNNTSSDITLDGYSIQYASASNVGNFGATSNTILTGVIKSGSYFLAEEAAGGTTHNQDIPTPDFVSATSLAINMSNTSGQIALVLNATPLASTDFANNNPASSRIVDFVGFGATAARYEGAGNTGVNGSGTLSVIRDLASTPNTGFMDTNDNSADFQSLNVTPHNSASPGVGIAPTPEPSSVAGMLIGIGLLGAVAVRRRVLA